MDTWYLVECYTKNPDTGERGWDIQFIFVQARSRTEAGELASRHLPNHDEMTTCGQVCGPEPLSGCQSLVLQRGASTPELLEARAT